MKRLEAVAVEMRAELDNMKRGERKAKAKLRKVHRIISQIRNVNRQASNNNSHSQLYIDAILHLLDGNSLVSFDLIYTLQIAFSIRFYFSFCHFICSLNFPDEHCFGLQDSHPLLPSSSSDQSISLFFFCISRLCFSLFIALYWIMG